VRTPAYSGCDCHEHPRDTATASSRDLARQKTGPPRPMRLASGCARLAAIKRKRAIPTVGSGLHLLFTAINGTAANLHHGKPTQEVDIVDLLTRSHASGPWA